MTETSSAPRYMPSRRGLVPALVLGVTACAPSTDGAGEATATTTVTSSPASATDETAAGGEETAAVAWGCDDPSSAVTELFAARCTAPGCHGTDGAAAGLVLEGSWSDAIVSQPTSLCEGRVLVAPGDPASSDLWILLSDQSDCGERMPTGAAPLSAAEIDCVASWIEGVNATCQTCGTPACVDPDADPDNCGACGQACPSGVACQGGACACPGGGQVCAGACVDTMASGPHCGGCDSPCDAGPLYLQGECVDDCGTLTECAGACVDTTTNPLHCGGFDDPCAGGSACLDSACDCGLSVSFASDVEPILVANCGQLPTST